MAASNLPIYPQQPICLTAQATSALTDLSTPGAQTVEFTLPADIETDGGQIVGLWAVPLATTTQTNLYLFISLDNGTTKRLALAQGAAPNTVSTTAAPVPVYFQFNGGPISLSNPVQLQSGASTAKMRVYGAISVAGTWNFHLQVLRNTKAAV